MQHAQPSSKFFPVIPVSSSQNLPGLQALYSLHSCIHNNREFYPNPVCSLVSLSPSLNDKPGKSVHCPYQFLCCLRAGGRPSGAQRSRRTGARPGGGSRLRSCPWPLLPSPSRPESQRTRNPSNCGQRSATISNSGAARLFLHLPGQLCMSMAWGGPGDGSSTESGSQSWSPAGWNALHTRVIELPGCVPFNALIFSLPCSVSLCLHKALNFRTLLMHSEFLNQKYNLFKSTVQHVLIFTNQDKVDEHSFHDPLISVFHIVFHVYVANNCDELALDWYVPRVWFQMSSNVSKKDNI